MKRRRPRSSSLALSVALHVALVLLAAASLFPIAWLACASLKRPQDIFTSTLLPWHDLASLSLGNFEALFRLSPFRAWLVNSLFISSTQTISVVIVSSLGGFALAKYRFRFRQFLTLLMLGTLMLPSQVLLPSSYELMYKLGWIDSYAALLVPGAVSVFGVILYRQTMLGVPDELLSAARIDGASELRLWWDIAMPLCSPMTGALALLAFLGSWNAFLWPQVMLQDERKLTLTVGLASLVGTPEFQTQYGVLMAGTLLGILPILVLFVALQGDLVAGLTGGALKQ